MFQEIPALILNNGRTMPMAGLGTYKIGEDNFFPAVQVAAEAGCRLFDTAAFYRNEEVLGDAIRSCGVPRSELFIVTKVWNTAQQFGDVRSAFLRSLDRLGLDYIDLYMIHWPVPGCYEDTWNVMEDLVSEGLARSIGVSNFDIEHLARLKEVSDTVPAVDQIEFHPLWNRNEILQYCRDAGIAVQAYAPLARGAYLDRETIIQIANKHRKSPAQIGLRWLIEKGVSVIPRSQKPEHILSNLELFDFSLDDIDMQMIDAMNEDYRSAGVPDDMRTAGF